MTSESPKRVYFLGKKLAEFHAALQAALEPYNAAVSCFSGQEECLEKLSEKPCDLLIVDLSGCEVEGTEVLTQARRMAPWIATVALVDRTGVRGAVKAMKAGASDCLEKPVREDRLRAVIEGHLGGKGYSGPRVRRTLTQMEVQVLHLILEGKTSRDIAAELHRSKRTIDVHRKNIMRKLEACGPVDLIKRALGMGLTELHECDDDFVPKDP